MKTASGPKDKLDPVWKALADPTRRSILDLLRGAPQLLLRVGRIGEDGDEAGADHQADRHRDHQLDQAESALQGDAQAAFTRDVLDLIEQRNRSQDRTLVLPSEYLEVVITRRAS